MAAKIIKRKTIKNDKEIEKEGKAILSKITSSLASKLDDRKKSLIKAKSNHISKEMIFNLKAPLRK